MVGVAELRFNFLTLHALARIESELHSAALRVGFCLAAMLLRRRLEGAQTADLLENTLGIQLVFQPLQCAIDRFTFTNNHFWHQSSLPAFRNLSQKPSRRVLGLDNLVKSTRKTGEGRSL